MNDSASSRYEHRSVEAKWQQHWRDQQSFRAGVQTDKPSYYVLEMFPYPSGKIHMGHLRNYTLGDVLARYKRMQGFDVLHPMGWDAFGLPAENAAIERKVHPGAWTHQNIDAMRTQLQSIGLSYDWERELATCDADYYQHEQRFFLKMLEHGLAYRKESYVNWDPVDNTVLANEQVVDGCGWRSGAPVERRKLSQWFLKITDFAEDLLEGIEQLGGWPEKVRIMQENWIGKSSGAKVRFQVNSDQWDELEVYTTRPDTLFGMSFLAISPQHPLAAKLAENNPKLADFVTECEQGGTTEAAIETAEKKGFDTGITVTHPFTGEEKPVYVANFVLMDYGTGAVFGCPAHDERDHEFSTKYNLPITRVVQPADGSEPDLPYSDDGLLINSDFLDGLSTADAKEKAITTLEAKAIGERQINYRLRDWGVSRQRYWGCPIPIIHCDDCGAVPVPEDQLPVTLPEDVSFDQPGNPLDHHPSWKHLPCPSCGKAALRETDTFDTFFESSWYFARFCSPGAAEGINQDDAARFLPVDYYVGGIEHAVLHLLYSRFFTRALTKCGIINVKEPFKQLMTQGMVCHQTFKDADGNWLYPEEAAQNDAGAWVHAEHGTPVVLGRSEKMSKSKRNTVDPQQIIENYGADTARLFMLSDSPPERDLEWSDSGIDGSWRYVRRLWSLIMDASATIGQIPADAPALSALSDPAALTIRKSTHRTLAIVTQDLEQLHYNKAVAHIREFTNMLGNASPEGGEALVAYREAVMVLIQLLSPLMPHLAEECWSVLGYTGFASEQSWPTADDRFLEDDKVTLAVQVNGKLRGTLELAKDSSKQEAEEAALALENIQRAIEDKTVRKVIVVPGKIVNVVAA